MDKSLQKVFSKELEQFHCSILLDEVKEKVRKLKAYGVEDAEIMAAMNEDNLFPQLIVTKDYKVVLAGEKPVEVEMEPLVKAVIYFSFASRGNSVEESARLSERVDTTVSVVASSWNDKTGREEHYGCDKSHPKLHQREVCKDS